MVKLILLFTSIKSFNYSTLLFTSISTLNILHSMTVIQVCDIMQQLGARETHQNLIKLMQLKTLDKMITTTQSDNSIK